MEKQLKIISAVVKSAILTTLLIAVLTIFGELSPPLKNWLKVAFGHHWIAKSILALGLFVTATILFLIYPQKPTTAKLIFWLQILLVATIVGVLAILGVFIYEAF